MIYPRQDNDGLAVKPCHECNGSWTDAVVRRKCPRQGTIGFRSDIMFRSTPLPAVALAHDNYSMTVTVSINATVSSCASERP
ncbi:hypothetical protein MRB53_040328 [Persea americana]|nr:hypothetical protein MRB53_040328 [Persea americana]